MHLIIVDKDKEIIARRYKIPIHILAGIRGNPFKVAEAYSNANIRDYFEVQQALHNELELLGRPTNFRAKRIKKEDQELVLLQLTFPTVQVVKYIDYEDFKKYTTEEWIQKLTDWVYAKIKRKRARIKDKEVEMWIAEKLQFVKINVDRDTFINRVQRLVNARIQAPVLGALGELLGFPLKPMFFHDNESVLLQLVVTIFTIPLVSADPVHALIFSEPGIGKTTIALLYKHYLKWEYYNEIPSLASLVGDARTGKSRIAGCAGVWFDEVDKWFTKQRKASELADIVEVLLTGMEQGIWKRSKGGEKTIEIKNDIPVVFSGNSALPTEPRSKLRALVGRVTEDAIHALDERIGYAVDVHAGVSSIVMKSTWEAVTGRSITPKPSVMRGAVEVLKEWWLNAPEPKEIPFQGRFARHYKRIYKALHVLFAKNPLKNEWAIEDLVALLAKNLVKGLKLSRVEDLQNLT